MKKERPTDGKTKAAVGERQQIISDNQVYELDYSKSRKIMASARYAARRFAAFDKDRLDEVEKEKTYGIRA